MREVKEVSPEKILSNQGQSWFSEEVEMENETSFIAWKDALKAMREYAEAIEKDNLLKFLDWYTSLSPTSFVSVWSKDGQYSGLFSKDNEQMVDSYFDQLKREAKKAFEKPEFKP